MRGAKVKELRRRLARNWPMLQKQYGKLKSFQGAFRAVKTNLS